MRDSMERLVLLPFAVGCMSESSVGVASPPARRSPAPVTCSPSIRHGEAEREESDDGTSSNEGTKSSMRSLSLRKTNISTGIHRMFKGFKNISHMFAVYKEDMEEEEIAIEIGLPTDVKHVTHIGWDGCSANSDHLVKGCRWDNHFIDPLLLSNNDLTHQLSSPGPTTSGPKNLQSRPGRRQNLQTANPEPHSMPLPLKG